MTEDLEEVLAIEVARTGEAGGEATTVLRALPGDTAEFVPVRLRNPRRWLLTLRLVGVLGAAAVLFLAGRTEKGPGEAVTPRAGGLTRVQLSSGAAKDYDPQGDQQESPEATQNAIDGNLTTVWDTERYRSDLQSLGKDGVGLYVDAGKPVAARRLDLVTPTPGFTASAYGANEVPEDIGGWSKVSGDSQVTQDARIRLGTGGKRFRHYLVWITSLPEANRAEIAELTLRK